MRVCFVIPYFGRLPEWFPFWLKTCEYNKAFHWLLITDDKRKFEYPENVEVRYTSFYEIKKAFQEKLGFELKWENAYKLCDYKPLYGFLFEQQLKDYSHWGYTDIDTLWGDLSKFITPDMLNKYDKIQKWGHLSIYKNTSSINEVFKDCDYKNLLNSEAIYVFDEPAGKVNINKILQSRGKSILDEIKYADVSISHYNMRYIDSLERTMHVIRPASVFSFSEGSLYANFIRNGEHIKEEYAYVHFQKRKIKCNERYVTSHFLLEPNQIFNIDNEFDLCSRIKQPDAFYFFQKKMDRFKWKMKNERLKSEK